MGVLNVTGGNYNKDIFNLNTFELCISWIGWMMMFMIVIIMTRLCRTLAL